LYHFIFSDSRLCSSTQGKKIVLIQYDENLILPTHKNTNRNHFGIHIILNPSLFENSLKSVKREKHYIAPKITLGKNETATFKTLQNVEREQDGVSKYN